MSGEYEHYIRINSENIVIDRYSDWEGKYQDGDILAETTDQRKYNFPYITASYQFMYKWEASNSALILRTQTELDEELAARPARPPSMAERISALEALQVSNMGL